MSQQQAWKQFEAVTRPALELAPSDYLEKIRTGLVANEIPDAVAERDTPWLFNCLVGAAQYQGISDRNAGAYIEKHGLVRWDEVAAALDAGLACPRLRSYWSFSECRYRKGAGTCSEPRHLRGCSVPTHPTRKGSLIVAAYSLALFLRDVCDGDLVSWIDRRLAEADPGFGMPDRAVTMDAALLGPLREIYGIGDKVWSMVLSDILVAADPNRERWVTTGAGMIAIDSLMHNFLHRSGTLRRFHAEHAYGPRCYAPGGCADLIRSLADRIDARDFNPAFPVSFPRFVQHAIWRLCSASDFDICNGNRIDDLHRCNNVDCPTFSNCDRIVLTSQKR